MLSSAISRNYRGLYCIRLDSGEKNIFFPIAKIIHFNCGKIIKFRMHLLGVNTMSYMTIITTITTKEINRNNTSYIVQLGVYPVAPKDDNLDSVLFFIC